MTYVYGEGRYGRRFRTGTSDHSQQIGVHAERPEDSCREGIGSCGRPVTELFHAVTRYRLWEQGAYALSTEKNFCNSMWKITSLNSRA